MFFFSQLSEEQRQAIPRLVQSGACNGLITLLRISRTLRLRSTIVFKRAFLRLWLFRNGLRGVWRCETSCSRRVSQGRWQTSTSFFARDVVKFFIEAGALVITEVEVNRADSYFEKVEKTDFLELNVQQAHAVEEMMRQISQGGKSILIGRGNGIR